MSSRSARDGWEPESESLTSRIFCPKKAVNKSRQQAETNVQPAQYLTALHCRTMNSRFKKDILMISPLDVVNFVRKYIPAQKLNGYLLLSFSASWSETSAHTSQKEVVRNTDESHDTKVC